jgi:hypothetical protein
MGVDTSGGSRLFSQGVGSHFSDGTQWDTAFLFTYIIDRIEYTTAPLSGTPGTETCEDSIGGWVDWTIAKNSPAQYTRTRTVYKNLDATLYAVYP